MVVTAKSINKLQVEVTSGDHVFIVDEPEGLGGGDLGPNPYKYLMGALAGCKIITVQMYAKRKKWELESVEVSLKIDKVYAKDCEESESHPDAKIDVIYTEIRFDGNLTEDQRLRLKEISERCPVHRTLTSETIIRTKML